MSFSGFSEDDIKKLSNSQLVNAPKNDPPVVTKKAILKQTKKQQQNNTSNVEKHLKAKLANLVPQDIPSTDGLLSSKPKLEATPENVNSTPDSHNINNSNNNNNHVEHSKDFVEFSEQRPRIIDLDEFEQRQKLMEEQNRKRKELLSKALADRTKRTQEEAQRLNEIQEEFKKLDAVLSNDVKILRKQIEVASVEFMECQKKFHRIEKEYAESKLNLHQKLEKKELLKEHLCAIIEKNEERKAEKLNELFEKLQFEPREEKNDISESSVTNDNAT